MNYQERIEWFKDKGYHVDTLRHPRSPNENAVVQLSREGLTTPLLIAVDKRGVYKHANTANTGV